MTSLSRRPRQPGVARIWRGATRPEDASRYREVLRADAQEVRGADGNVAVFVLETVVDARAEYIFLSLWESMDSVVEFAGADVERAVYFRDDSDVLLELTPRVDHYQVVAANSDSGLGPGG